MSQMALPGCQTADYGQDSIMGKKRRHFLKELEAGAMKAEVRQEETRKTILEAVDFYLKKAKDEGNTPDTLNKMARSFKGLVTENPGVTNTLAEKIEATKKAKGKFSPSLLAWAEERGFKYLTDLKLQQMVEWRSTWVAAGITRSKRQEKVCGFFHLCRDLGWIEKTPIAGIGAIKVEETATGYFPPEEYARFFRTIDAWNDGRCHKRERIRLKVLTELMRWSGLAIGDACTLKRDRLGKDDSVFLYRGKTVILFVFCCRPFLRLICGTCALRAHYEADHCAQDA